MRDRKNLLFLAQRVPFPPDKGDKIRTFHQLDRLTLTNNVYCACFVETQRELRKAKQLRRWCEGVIAIPFKRRTGLRRSFFGLFKNRSFTEAAYRDRRMMRGLARWCRNVDFDVAVAFSSSMAQYALRVPARRRVLDMCDVDSQKWQDYAEDSGGLMSPLYRREARLLRSYEQMCLDRFDATILITDRERALLDAEGTRPDVHVISNGVTLCSPVPAPASKHGPTITFVGAMDYKPNADGVCRFVRDVWPTVYHAVPGSQFFIVGRNPTRQVRRLAKVRGVVVTGEVQDPRIYLSRSRVCVAPLDVARGLQNKVLEAMAMRRPVVTTSAVAAALKAEPFENILVADDAKQYAATIVDLCRYDGFCDKIADGGYRCVATHYAWPDSLDRYEAVVLDKPVPEPKAAGAACEETSKTGRIFESAPRESSAMPVVISGRPTENRAATIEAYRAEVSRGRSPYAAMMRGEHSAPPVVQEEALAE